MGNNAGMSEHTGTTSWVHRPWVPIVAGAAAFLLVLMTGLVVLADWAVRTSEMRSLIIGIYASESVMEDFQEASLEAVRDHQAGSVRDQGKLDGQLRDLATIAREDLALAGAEIASLPILPWHRSVVIARDTYLLHNDAWQQYTDRVIDDPSELLRDQPLVNSTFEDAQAPLLAAIPQPDVLDLESDIWVIYAPPEETSGEVVSTSVSR